MEGAMTRPSGSARGEQQPAFVLHTYPFRETSLIVETFTRDFGRVPLVARGARRPRSPLRGVLLAFQPLLLSWSGKSELRTLHRAEWQGGFSPVCGAALVCGFYLNELLLKLLARDDPHEGLFGAYVESVAALGRGERQGSCLRRFEVRLLRELGYALTLDRDVSSGEPVDPLTRYAYIIDRGPVAVGGDTSLETTVELSGRTLLDMQAEDYSNGETLQESKALMRMLINHHLGTQTLHTRQLLHDLQQI